MENINNIQNLDSILFYSGPYAVQAAEYTEGREYGSYVDGLGYLSKGNDSTSYFSNYPNVRYKERNSYFENMNDLFQETLSYVTANKDAEDIIGYSYIKNNRYNVIYTYETDLKNDFDTARPIVRTNLEEFLVALNTQKYNKQAKYGDTFEVSSIKIDQTYFKWYPENTVAYYNTEITETPFTYTYYFVNDNPNNMYEGEMNDQLSAYLDERGGLHENEYVHSYSYTDTIITTEDIPYIIGGNYYSYVKQSYDTIRYKLDEKIDEKLSDFEERYNHDTSIYAYYMYDCNSDIQMLLTTQSLGVKESTFKIGFDSRFSKWFDNVINIHANLEEGDTIANITSSADGQIFSIFRNNIDRITGDNVTIDKDQKYSFVTNSAVSMEDTINILTPYAIDTLDLSPIKTKISNILDLNETNWIESGSQLKKLILDNNDGTSSNIEKIFGLNDITSLEYVDMSNLTKLSRTPAIDKLENLKVFKANNTPVDSFRPKKGTELYDVELPGTVKSIKLVDNKFSEGTLTVAGNDMRFFGEFNYTPNDTLTSLTLRNIDNGISYKLVHDWYDAVEAADKLDSVIYLELEGIDWKNIKASELVNFRHFDINPGLSGKVSIIGSGNYNYITRNEYRDITRTYGVNAFIHGDVTNKVFKNLDIDVTVPKETFEFSLKAFNRSVAAYNESFADDTSKIRYKDTLDIEFKGYRYESNGTIEYEIDPYVNRAANAFLDIIYSGEQREFTFIKDDIENYAYCKLDTSIDTYASDEVKKIQAGDVMLFNSDTIMIFFADTDNSIYEYIKLGNIYDELVEDVYGREYSSIEHWFDYNNAATIEFIPSVREKVIDNIELIVSDENIHETEEVDKVYLDVVIRPEILEAIAMGEVKLTEIVVETSDGCIEINPVSEYRYELIINYDYAETKSVIVSVYVNGAKEETLVTKEIKLISDNTGSYIEGDTLMIIDSDALYDDASDTLIIDGEYDPEALRLKI